MDDASGTNIWANFLQASLRLPKTRSPAWQKLNDSVATISDNSSQSLSPDPEKLAYLRRLIAYIVDGRDFVVTYNYVLLVVLVLLSVLHWRRKLLGRRKWKQSVTRSQSAKTAEDVLVFEGQQRPGEDFGSQDLNQPSSSSSSTLQDSSALEYTSKMVDSDADIERQPLLGFRGRSPLDAPRQRYAKRLPDAVAAWLMYQPRPIPIINRTLPSNGTSLFVLAYVALNIFYNVYQIDWRPEYFFSFADRAGVVFIVNLPLLYLLAAKNQPLKFLTGRSYEALNIFHRRVGELMCFEAFVHTLGMIIWELWCSPEWLLRGNIWHFLTGQLVLLGLGAFAAYELLYLTSLGSFRQRWYEVFLASHVVLQVAALVFLYLHFSTAQPYVAMALVIFLADRLIWRVGLKRVSMKANLDILDDGSTLLLSADWDIPRSTGWGVLARFRQSIVHGWRPMDHVFISASALGRTHMLQAHPFTIASAAPKPCTSAEASPPHAWLSLLIRAHGGFTGDLLRYAQEHSSISVRLDGPYGSTDAIDMLRARDTIILIAGGSGIAVVFPLLWALVHEQPFSASLGGGAGKEFHLLWAIHSRAQRSWMLQECLDELAQAGVHITIPEPTAEAGRPDIGSYVANLALRGDDQELGVVVSGPDAMNRAARNACARAVKNGADVKLRIEKFGW
ncbi:uncharacterized protein BCR38DRAFT_450831 [Pseudomassariella vexata]|uniref:FAD-binding FR-type domain-containing protein n=1 Tax=Pseudomassariella vexata TaxID=1141098 RepID=A0A1Y2DBT5_9PEZI|nr:uncharacterized protein BCR38DRAFT_450831 [Pseudomassariella vexata]ORY56657.1 hypothetical protein BCR38DRAFT_450831 [Pseudomassariella vexata]